MNEKKDASAENKMCFVVMPITDPDGYVKGHFKHVYQDIVYPACQQAGFKPVRADEVKQSNLIHLDILQKLIEAPMAICDLSNRNPNVLFELALRQAFDKPVALIQETGTPQIFDISPLRYAEYRKERIYHEVLEDQKTIAGAIEETFNSHGNGRSINSIVKLLALSKPAALPEIGSPEARADYQQIILAELSQLRDEVRLIRKDTNFVLHKNPRREINPELAAIRRLIIETEKLFASEDDIDFGLFEDLLGECRKRMFQVLRDPSFERIPQSEKERIMHMDRQIDMLDMSFHQRRNATAKKKA
jgi:hypothetical protein